MSREAVGKLIDRWINEPAFRAELRADSERTVRRSGVKLDAEEWAALRAIDWRLSDEELQARVSSAII